MSAIRYLTNTEIDKSKWDDCIRNAINGLIYAYAFYLDAMAENWDGLVLGDYEAVMPLVWRKKWRIRYLYQPAFTQQGGVFFLNAVSPVVCAGFIQAASARFKFAEIRMNYANDISSGSGCTVSPCNNYFLNLSGPYNEQYKNYHPSFTKSLRRINKFNLRYAGSTDFEAVIKLSRDLYGERLTHVTEADYLQFEKLCSGLSGEENLIIRKTFTNANELVAAVILLKDDHRLYNIISCITETGKKLEANYFLYDRIIEEFAGSGLLLDFEGSDIKGIAAFYQKFNPQSQPYSFLKYNHLPAAVKIFKP